MMRLFVLATAAVSFSGANGQVVPDGDAPGSATGFDNPAYHWPVEPWTDLSNDLEPDARCADQIRRARAEAGLPALDPEAARPDDAMLIWAVDHRRGDCPVVVPAGRPGDIRPVPEYDGPVRLLPADK